MKRVFNKFKNNACSCFKRTTTKINNFFKEKNKKQKIISLLKKVHNFLKDKNVYFMILCIIPFIAMDITLRIYGHDVTIYPVYSFAPRFFSLAYIILLIGLTFNMRKRFNKMVYVSFYLFFLIMFLVHGVYYSATNNYFDFSMLGLASEGSSYMIDVIKNCNVTIYIIFVILLIMLGFLIKFFPKKDLYNKKGIIITIIIFLCMHLISKEALGRANFELTWDTWRTPRNIYNNFNDTNKCMAISGFYEYTFRDIYINFIKPKEKKNETENNFLLDVFGENNDSYSKNSWTGKFKDKNVIFLQMEGIDNWLLTKDIMPNTYALLNNSINFTNHYSFYNGGGSTFNSEFAVNVGYMTPWTYPQNAYSLNKNDFPYSLANLLKTKDYDIKAFHMNSSEYYSRGINYQNWGYDRYFGLKDLGDYSDSSYELDRELILNQTFYDEMFKQPGKFANYIITYSNHLPFSTTKGVCRKLLNIDYEKEMTGMTSHEKDEFIASLNYTEEDCIKRQAKETDYMVSLLIKALKDNDLYNNTVIVAYADHYLYTVSDDDILKNNGKDVDSNLVNKTPFFIWSAGMKPTTVTKVTSQLNILPTVLNLFGIEYNEKWYVMQDALSKNYQGVAIFSDLSWYDGNVYVVDGAVKNGKKITDANLEKKNNLVEYLVKKNDLVLKYDYFKDIAN